MITIDQLLESVDLDFEPRWVTKSNNDRIDIFDAKPESTQSGIWWIRDTEHNCVGFHYLKISEFENKHWAECIYEVPRKTDEQNLEKLRPADSDLVYRVKLPRKTTGNEIEQKMLAELERKLNAIVDAAIEAVNELKGAKNE